jgi:hypothetical protein
MKWKWLRIILFGCIILIGIILIMVINRPLDNDNNGLAFVYPFKGALFPPEFPSPTFFWNDEDTIVRHWKVEVTTQNKSYQFIEIVSKESWIPDSLQWDSIKSISDNKKIFVRIERFYDSAASTKRRPYASTYISISKDEVGAPILYREIPLPFDYAEKHPDSMAYRLVNVGSNKVPHVVMKKFMVCGNCHSYSNDGSIIGLDFDAAHRDKGGYFIANIEDTVRFDTSNYLSWNKLQDDKSFGMLSKISPSGRYVATTIKDRVISQSFGMSPDIIPFSQLFFPVNGIIAIYDRETGKLTELPGANLEEYVQSNSFWTPDEKYIVFSRAKAFPYTDDEKDFLLDDPEIVQQFIDKKRDFKFDICIIPFNDGKGGEAIPIKGASDNGMSNFFPAVSPDGEWLVFCKAENYMLLQPDSRMYIVPLKGGKAKKMNSNLYLMNSWHAWSPNGKWLVFVSKGMSVYTDLFLTHVDEKGNSSYPVLIEKARKRGRAANYPEFINQPPDYTFKMVYNYVNLDHIKRALLAKDTALALNLYEQYLGQNQYSLENEYIFLGRFNIELKRYKKAIEFLELAINKESGNSEANGLLQLARRKLRED